MIIKASKALRNEYNTISELARQSNEPIYITKNGEGDGVFMSIDAYERREQLLDLETRVLKAEAQRLNGEKTMTIEEARAALAERRNEGI